MKLSRFEWEKEEESEQTARERFVEKNSAVAAICQTPDDVVNPQYGVQHVKSTL